MTRWTALLTGFIFASAQLLTGQTGLRCSPHGEPKKLPAVADLADSTGLASSLRALGESSFDHRIALHQAPSGAMTVFAVGDDPAGSVIAAAVQSALRQSYRLDGPSVVLHAKSISDTVRLAVERSTFCPPTLAAGEREVTTITVTAPASEMQRSGGRIVLRVLVAVDGTVRQADVQSSSGSPSVDGEFARQAQMRRYVPARLNGRPVEAWLVGKRAEIAR